MSVCELGSDLVVRSARVISVFIFFEQIHNAVFGCCELCTYCLPFFELCGDVFLGLE